MITTDFQLDVAADWIGTQLARYGRINILQTKEKYGEVRVYVIMGAHSLLSLYRPHTAYYYRNDFERFLDMIKVPAIIDRLIYKYQTIVYRAVYKRAIKKWPELRTNILDGADNSELLGGL